VQGAVLGKKVARQLRREFFRPLDRADSQDAEDDDRDF
jgi:hypothetical protein